MKLENYYNKLPRKTLQVNFVCKHVKFDKDNDRKDNNQTGTQSPPGFSSINSTNLYTRFGPVANSTLGIAESIAVCDVGDVVFEGKHEIQNDNGNPIFFEFEGSSFTFPNRYIYQILADDIFIQATAVCFNNP